MAQNCLFKIYVWVTRRVKISRNGILNLKSQNAEYTLRFSGFLKELSKTRSNFGVLSLLLKIKDFDQWFFFIRSIRNFFFVSLLSQTTSSLLFQINFNKNRHQAWTGHCKICDTGLPLIICHLPERIQYLYATRATSQALPIGRNKKKGFQTSEAPRRDSTLAWRGYLEQFIR